MSIRTIGVGIYVCLTSWLGRFNIQYTTRQNRVPYFFVRPRDFSFFSSAFASACANLERIATKHSMETRHANIHSQLASTPGNALRLSGSPGILRRLYGLRESNILPPVNVPCSLSVTHVCCDGWNCSQLDRHG